MNRLYVRQFQALEAMGDPETALARYQRFLTKWREADQSLLPIVEALEAVERLGG